MPRDEPVISATFSISFTSLQIYYHSKTKKKTGIAITDLQWYNATILFAFSFP
jgi:hypothetical protein